MATGWLARLLFSRIVLTVAILAGAAQVGLGHWLQVVAFRLDAPGAPFWLAAAVLLVAANALLVPALRRARGRDDLPGRVAWTYIEFAVSSLLLGAAVAATWAVWIPVWTVLSLAGGDTAAAFAAFRWASIAVVGATFLAIVWGYTIGQAVVDHTHLRVTVPRLHASLGGLRIVQISDLHIGNQLEDQRLDVMIERTNALAPDVIVVTGDIFDRDRSHVEDGAKRLAGLRARHGVYAILGNHDTYVGTEFVAKMLGSHAPGVRLLRDEIVRLPTAEPLYLAGVEDPGRDWYARGTELEGLTTVAEARPEDGPVLLLVHRPQAFHQAERHGFPLVLAGHTHGGQLALPTPGGQYNLSSLMSPYTRGLYRRNGTTMYVNRGIGVGGPALRINCPREISTIELVAG